MRITVYTQDLDNAFSRWAVETTAHIREATNNPTYNFTILELTIELAKIGGLIQGLTPGKVYGNMGHPLPKKLYIGWMPDREWVQFLLRWS